MAQKQWFKLLQVTLQVPGAAKAKAEPCWDPGWRVSLSVPLLEARQSCLAQPRAPAPNSLQGRQRPLSAASALPITAG